MSMREAHKYLVKTLRAACYSRNLLNYCHLIPVASLVQIFYTQVCGGEEKSCFYIREELAGLFYKLYLYISVK